MGIKATSRNRAFKGIAVLWITLQQEIITALAFTKEESHSAEIEVALLFFPKALRGPGQTLQIAPIPKPTPDPNKKIQSDYISGTILL